MKRFSYSGIALEIAGVSAPLAQRDLDRLIYGDTLKALLRLLPYSSETVLRALELMGNEEVVLEFGRAGLLEEAVRALEALKAQAAPAPHPDDLLELLARQPRPQPYLTEPLQHAAKLKRHREPALQADDPPAPRNRAERRAAERKIRRAARRR